MEPPPPMIWLLRLVLVLVLVTRDTVASSVSVREPTGSYLSYTSTETLSTSTPSLIPRPQLANLTTTKTATTVTNDLLTTTSSQSYTLLIGGESTTTTFAANVTGNATRTTVTFSSSSSPVVNTQPCNGYPEFCSRSYSNITMVAAHNSPFVRPGNVASNQALPVLIQLQNGIRMCKFLWKEQPNKQASKQT